MKELGIYFGEEKRVRMKTSRSCGAALFSRALSGIATIICGITDSFWSAADGGSLRCST